ncbi:MAG: SDR family oxidoreductase [Streptosporangiaceae bacterium]|jgi:3-oxoacyl-[acyl-carrier protein] reductase
MGRSDRVVAVTGASGGIGLAIARHRAELGDRVLITGRRLGPLQSAAEAIGPAASALVADSADPASAGLIVAAALERFGGLDVVVANAAHVPPLTSLLDAAESDIDLVWQTNVADPLRLVRAAARGPFAGRGGIVVMVGSLGGQALQVRTEGARIGWEAAESTIRARSPLGRLGEVDDIANTVDFLIDERSSWMTGQVLVVDGGASVQLGRRGRRPTATLTEARS